MLLLLLIQAAASTLTPPPPRVNGSLRTLFSFNDYPKEAIRHNWQGTVVADITINDHGVVRLCNIVRSSGYKVLDDKTCEILSARARFVPAKDADGRPTEDVQRTPPIVWLLVR